MARAVARKWDKWGGREQDLARERLKIRAFRRPIVITAKAIGPLDGEGSSCARGVAIF